jgi:hypothetical protein
MGIAAAIAAGHPFLNWGGRRKSRVMYLDGELPAETFKERMQLLAKTYGADIEFYGYNRDVLGSDDMPPLNTDEGEKWLIREIELVRPDCIFFDSIMCLLIGPLSDEEPWARMKPVVRALSAKRIAQVWVNHTGHSGDRSFGTKTREWERDTVLALSKADDDTSDTAVQLDFKKARLRTPETADEFTSRSVRFLDNKWVSGPVVMRVSKREKSEVDAVRDAILSAYDHLADGAEQTHGFDGAKVLNVHVDELRNEVKSRGFLETNEKGGLTTTSRSHFRRAKMNLLDSRKLVESGGLIWRP